MVRHIRTISAESRGTYGSPRGHAELRLGLGLPVTVKRVARLRRQAGLQGLYRRRRGCTGRDPAGQPSYDLVGRQFGADAPNRLWITDVTGQPRAGGAARRRGTPPSHRRLVDRRPVRTELAADALGMAIVRRQPYRQHDGQPTIVHFDHGAQYTSWACGQRLRTAGLLAAMGTIGDCYDNAMMESFWGTMQLELLDSRAWETRDELANAVFE